MEAKKYLQDYALKADRFLNHFFARKKKEAAEISPLCSQMVEVFQNHLYGGKKTRGALMVLGYCLAGGKVGNKIMRASIFPELVQSFLLIHDDIMDRDFLRRGKPTPQAWYTSFYRERKFRGNAEDFGLSMAIDLGDLGMYLAQEALWESGFSPERIFKLMQIANQIYRRVAFGQALDIFAEASGSFNREYVFKIHRFKAAEYSITAPLQFGAILAGAPSKFLGLIKNYGDPVGIAFQLQDDVLGLVGDQKTLGKEAGARDIKEGKVTLLILKAREKAQGKDRRLLNQLYGKKDITLTEVSQVQRIIKETSSLVYSQKEAQRLVVKGKKYVSQITSKKKFQKLLYNLADFMIEREK